VGELVDDPLVLAVRAPVIDRHDPDQKERRGERDALPGSRGEPPREIGVGSCEHTAHNEHERLQKTLQESGSLSRPLMILRVGVSGISGTTTSRSGSLFLAIFFSRRYSQSSCSVGAVPAFTVMQAQA